MNSNYPSDLIKIITELVFIETPQNKLVQTDLIVIFGSKYNIGAIDALEDIMKKGLVPSTAKVILSGKNGSLNAGDEPEAKQMYDEIIRRGWDPSMFIIEDQSTNNRENILFSQKIINEQLGGFDQFHKITFIGMSFMLRRSQMAAKLLNWPDRIQYIGLVNPEGRNIKADSWWENADSKNRVLQEVERIGKYAASGDIGIF